MASVSWSTAALATLRFRDRYAQEDILRDFSIQAEESLTTLRDKAVMLSGVKEPHFTTPVLEGRYRVVWTVTDNEHVVVVAIAKNEIRDNSALESLIKAEGWDWRQTKA